MLSGWQANTALKRPSLVRRAPTAPDPVRPARR
jgi:hypothetical protein